MDKEKPKLACDEALIIKSRGYNCAQAAIGALAPHVGLDQDIAFKMMAGFGGGMRHKELCGAVLAAGLILSLKYGSSEPDKEADKKIKDIILKLVDRFKEKNGSTVCRELLERDIKEFEWNLNESLSDINDYSLKAPVCGIAITDAVALTFEIMEEE